MRLGLGLGINRTQGGALIPSIAGIPAFAGLRFDRGAVEPYGGLDFGAGFSRASAGTFIDAAGNIQTAGVNTARVQSVGGGRFGLLMEAGRTRLNPYVSIRSSWATAISATLTNLSESALGQFSGMRIASTNGNWNRADTFFNVTSGVTYAVKFLYRSGTSGRALFALRNSVAATESNVSGVVGALSVGLTNAGTVSILRDTPLAGSLRETVLLWAPSFTGAASIGIGPNSTTSGQTIDAFAWQVEAGTSDTAWILGDNNASVTRSPDLANIALPASVQTAMAAGYWIALQGAVMGGVTGGFDRVYQFDNGNDQNIQVLFRIDGSGEFGVAQFFGGAAQAVTTKTSAVNQRLNMATKFAASGMNNIWWDGAQYNSGAIQYLTPTSLRIAAADAAGVGKPASLLIERIDLFPPNISLADMAAYRSAMP